MNNAVNRLNQIPGTSLGALRESCVTMLDKGRQQVARKMPRSVPAAISLLYESKDGRLCLFEDSDGHLTAVRSDRFA